MPFDASELRKFTESGRAISAAANVGIEQWAKGEATAILKLWVHLAPIGNEQKTVPRSRLRLANTIGATRANAPGKSTINTGVRPKKLGPGFVWLRGANGKFRLVANINDAGGQANENRHFKSADWAAVSSVMSAFSGGIARTISAGKKAVGLARQSVLQIADSLSLPVPGYAKERGAVASDGKPYVNGYGTSGKDNGGFFVELVNTYPLGREANLDRALEAAVSSRVSYFQRNLESGVFKSMEKTAKAYPYIEVGP